ncbi:MAG: MCE family protein, partial [Bacteroidota bacterium]
FSSDDVMNTLQDNNKNLLAITNDFKNISRKLNSGEGTIGKFLNNNSVYENMDAATTSLQHASAKAQQMVSSLADFSSGLNKKGTLVNELVTDTTVFNSVKSSALQLQQLTDTANVLMNTLKESAGNSKTSVGVLLNDEEAGAHLKEIIKNLDSGSKKLDEDLEAAQHNFLLRGFFKRKAKEAKRDSTMK